MRLYKLTSHLTLLLCVATTFSLQAAEKLTGIPIGTPNGYNYETGKVEVDIQAKAFDGDLNTYFASESPSYSWIGLDLGVPHVINRIGWAPRKDESASKRVHLGIIQGANREDFMDAVPLLIIEKNGVAGEMQYADSKCTLGFRFVRYVSPAAAYCNIAELEFYGEPGNGRTDSYFQLTNLPTVCINTKDSEEPYDKIHNIEANIIILKDGKVYLEQSGSVRERGNGSRTFPKKPWRIKLDKKQRVLPDAPAKAKKWTLINNYGDKTLIRNMVAFEIARRLEMPYVPYAHPVDVILNGEYKGAYQLCDQVEVNSNRLDITEMEATDTSGEALTGGYFFEIDAYAHQEPEGEWFTTSNQQIPVTIKSPDEGGTPEQFAYLKNYLDKLEQSVFNISGNISADDYRNIFDIESFINHFIVGELSGNTDTYWSTFMYKKRGYEKIYTGPVWDFDLAFENDKRTYPIHSTSGSTTYICQTSNASAATGMKEFVDKIISSDPRTKQDISRIWSVARIKRGLDFSNITQYIDSLSQEMEVSQKLNFERWPIMLEFIQQNPVISGSYANEVERIKSYLKRRFEDLDILMGYDSQYDDSGVETLPIDNKKNGIEKIRIVDRQIYVDDNEIFTVYSPIGMRIWSGTNISIPLDAGIYLVRTKTEQIKIMIK